ENTRGKPNKEYSLAGLFTLDELNTVLPQIIKKNKLIYISSHNHAIGLFYWDNEYLFYDSNAKGIVSHIDISTLSNAIFKSFRYDKSRASQICFKMYSIEDNPDLYPPQETLLRLHPPATAGYAGNFSGLMAATKIGCAASANFYLSQKETINKAYSFQET